MAKRLQEAEKALEEMRSGKDRPASHQVIRTLEGQHDRVQESPRSNSTNCPSGTDDGVGSLAEDFSESTVTQPVLSARGLNLSSARHLDAAQEPSPIPHQTTAPLTTPRDPIMTDMSVDEHGEICYYGPTSAVHDPTTLDSPDSHASSLYSGAISSDKIRSNLISYARESATWEEFALKNASMETGIPYSVLGKLLHVHWTWVSPMFMWIYRPSFVRK